LADGVYAAIHIDGGAAIGNAGIVDLGDRTLIYDTFLTPQAAEDLRIAAEALTGRPIDAVLNSHWHNDHIWGNQVFSANTEIISTDDWLFSSFFPGNMHFLYQRRVGEQGDLGA
jgi:cyclase